MRQLIVLSDEAHARALEDTLFVEGIESTVNETRDDHYAVWVHDEPAMTEALEILEEFQANPESARFQNAKKIAAKQRRVEAQRTRREHERFEQRKDALEAAAQQGGVGKLTLVIAAACMAIFVLWTTNQSVENLFFFRPVLIRQGELWRLVSANFIHFSWIHVGFNLLWLVTLGSRIERRHSSLTLAAQVLVFGLAANLQYFVSGHHEYGGLSGVVYGLFGYLWIRGRLDPSFGRELEVGTVRLMLFFFVLFFFVNPMGQRVANYAHTGGLLAGCLWAYLAARGWRRRGKRGGRRGG
ncbi:MAG: rhomboid family intramembrane serine protease [Myxococcales bacterium]|nr:rhomboid family intramembrane serine protease [Myxococcales bacterium]